MTNRRLIALATAALMLPGCAGPMVFTKAGITEAQYEMDRANCKFNAVAASPDNPFGDQFGLAQYQRVVMLYPLCMQGKGYTRIE